MRHTAYLYILYSPLLNKHYIGHTEHMPEERLQKHLTDHDGFTGKAKDWKIVYAKEFPDKKSAFAEERRVKSWKSSLAIKRLIAQNE